MSELREKTREELFEIAKKLELTVAKNISDESLLSKVEFALIEQHEIKVEKVREEIRAKSKLRERVAEVKASADLARIDIGPDGDFPKIPEDPTILDVIRLEKLFKIKQKIPKPSPETLAIEASKKVYAIFKEKDDVDIHPNIGGKYNFHFWPEKIHVLPEWLINQYRSKKNPFGKHPVSVKEEVRGHPTIAERMSRTKMRSRFTFEIIGDAPQDAKFGVVTDEEILSKLEQTVNV